MSNELIATHQDSKKVLSKARSLIELTNKNLNKKTGSKFQCWLPSKLTRICERAVDSHCNIIMLYNSIFDFKYAATCLIYKSKKSKTIGKNCLFIVESEFFRFILREKLESNQDIVVLLNDIHNHDIKSYDEIMIAAECDFETIMSIKDKNEHLSFLGTSSIEWNQYFPHNKIFEIDDFPMPPFEILDYARQYLPKDSRFNNTDFLEELKLKNSGADKPYIYKADSFDNEIEVIKGIIEFNPANNIAILLPFGSEQENFDMTVEKYYQAMKKCCFCTKYHDGVKLDELHNIVVTTYKDVKFIDFDIVVLPRFDIVKDIVEPETIFNAISSAKNLLFIINTKG